jgi:hypothetical protein
MELLSPLVPPPILVAMSAKKEMMDSGYWEVSEILKESPKKFMVQWTGEDEDGRPFGPSWVSKKDVTKPLVDEWKIKQRAQRSFTKGRENVKDGVREVSDGPVAGRLRSKSMHSASSILNSSVPCRHRLQILQVGQPNLIQLWPLRDSPIHQFIGHYRRGLKNW